MKFLISVFVSYLLSFLSFGQQMDVQSITYNEDNSSFPTSVCYNWNQLPNGELFVSGNAGLYRFDGVNFRHFPTRGRGVSISTSVFDKNGRLWCNSFHGDIYYMEDDSLIRHPISNTVRGLTALRLMSDRLFMYTETNLFEINPTTLEVKLLREFSIIRTIFEVDNQPYLLNSLEDDRTEIVNLQSNESVSFKEAFAVNSSCRFLRGDHTSYLFFDRERTFVEVGDVVNGNGANRHSLSFEGKINHVTLVDDQVAVCGMNGIHLYSKKGKWRDQLLSEIQITHFGKDQEGSYLATSMTDGLIFMPDLNVFRKRYSAYLDHENIIQSTFDQKRYIYLGTNAGKILRHDLYRDQIDVLELGLRSEVLSMQLSPDESELFVYCDDLYAVDIQSFSVKDKRAMSSVKEMALYHDALILGTRKGVEYADKNQITEIAELGWVISILPMEDRGEVLVSSKNGLFLIRMTSHEVIPVTFEAIDSDRTIGHLTYVNGRIFFIYDHQVVYQCNEDMKEVYAIYTHDKNDLNGLAFRNDRLFLFSKGRVTQHLMDGTLERSFSKLNGLHEKYTVDAYQFDGKMLFIHNESVSVFDGIPRTSRVQPVISFVLNSHSSFHQNGDVFSSAYEDNELIFRLNIRRALRSREHLKVFYSFDLSERNWKEIDNPFGEIRMERLPIGSGTIYFKAVNEAGVASSVISVPYYVDPPFYLTIWFFAMIGIALIAGVIFITKWRVQRARKKTLERLQKEKLESRALHAELTAIRSQMNPHFIFNVLTAIQAKVIQGKVDEAYTNIGDFAILIRNVLEKSGKEYISLEDEIALMKNYVELENSRLARPVELQIEVDDSSDFEDVFIPTLITQPLIENSIKHAFTDSKRSPKIILEARSHQDGFTLKVSDNGVGFDLVSKSNDHDSFALSALRKRIQTLSLTAPYTIDLSIQSDSLGTEVVFTFKYNQR